MRTSFERLRRAQSGFSLIELLVVVAIIAMLATLALPRVFEAINTAKRDATKGELATISGALARFYLEKGSYPKRLGELETLGLVKAGTEFKNKFDNYYLYAVDNETKPTAFVLADPGNKPTTGFTLCKKDAETNKAPQGENPSTGKIVYWKTGTSATNQLLTLQDGTAGTCTAIGTAPDSLSSWTSVRKDLFTE